MPDHAQDPTAPDPDADADGEHGLGDRLRGGGTGTEDHNIVGDVGPTDIPPGTDGDAARALAGEDDDPEPPAKVLV